MAHTIRHQGDVHMEAARPALTAPLYREALGLYRANPDPPALDFANAIRSLAILEGQTGAPADAIALWREARESLRTNRNQCRCGRVRAPDRGAFYP